MAQIIPKVTMKVAHRVPSKTSAGLEGTSSRGGEEGKAETEDEIAEGLESLGEAFAVKRRSGEGFIAGKLRSHTSAITRRGIYSGRKTPA
jgi:hypothetical protein